MHGTYRFWVMSDGKYKTQAPLSVLNLIPTFDYRNSYCYNNEYNYMNKWVVMPINLK